MALVLKVISDRVFKDRGAHLTPPIAGRTAARTLPCRGHVKGAQHNDALIVSERFFSLFSFEKTKFSTQPHFPGEGETRGRE